MDEEAAVLLEVHSTTKDANESSDGMGEWEDERCGIASDDGVVGAPGSSSSKSVGVEAGLEWSGWQLVPDLASRLAREFGLGAEWLSRLLWFLAFVSVLAPAFIRVAAFYLTSSRVKKSIVYGVPPRNRLDVILPPANLRRPARGFPVVIFVTGGAWIIGYKAWGALLGRRLAEQGILTVLLDYRNYPQGTAREMVEDVRRGVRWSLANVAKFGGDADNVHLAGQSAGAHLAALALTKEVLEMTDYGAEDMSAAAPSAFCRLRSFVGISGTYNVADQVDHFNRRGLHKSLLLSIMGAKTERDLDMSSPQGLIVEHHAARVLPSLADAMPRIVLIHGTADRSIPAEAAVSFNEVLEDVGASVTLKLLEGKTHVDPIVLDPIRGGRDVCVEELIGLAKGAKEKAAYITLSRRPLWFPFLVDFASSLCPF